MRTARHICLAHCPVRLRSLVGAMRTRSRTAGTRRSAGVAIPRRGDEDPNLKSQVKGHFAAVGRGRFAANLRLCSVPRRVAEKQPSPKIDKLARSMPIGWSFDEGVTQTVRQRRRQSDGRGRSDNRVACWRRQPARSRTGSGRQEPRRRNAGVQRGCVVGLRRVRPTLLTARSEPATAVVRDRLGTSIAHGRASVIACRRLLGQLEPVGG